MRASSREGVRTGTWRATDTKDIGGKELSQEKERISGRTEQLTRETLIKTYLTAKESS